MKSPFKFLDAYTLKDKEVFFGREEEVAALYQMVNKNRLILVYGQSGTGKTSLVQCGLAGEFDITDWYPLAIRRGEDINRALYRRLEDAAGFGFLKDFPGQLDQLYASIPKVRGLKKEGSWPERQAAISEAMVEGIREIYAEKLRPVYLIFDQLEELFILGTEAEQETFIYTLRDVLNAALPCRLLFILREEYLAHLYHFERVIPTLFDRRLRVEPMNYTNVGKVITSSCEKFNITLEAPERNLRQIIDNVGVGKSGIQLPYLQVYLDRMWRKDYWRTYGNGNEPSGDPAVEGYPPLEFTTEEIEDFGEIGDVLHDFLKEQEREMQEKLGRDHPGFPEQGVRQVLDLFVTEEGTKQPLPYERSGEEVLLTERYRKKLPAFGEAVLSSLLKELEQRRILRASENNYELAHDSLALLIYGDRDKEQLRLNEVLSQLVSNYNQFQKTRQYLTRKQLTLFEDDLPLLEDRLDDKLREFVKDSRAEVEREEREKRERQKQELEKERRLRGEAEKATIRAEEAKSEAEQAKNMAEQNARKAKILSWIAVVVAVVAIGAGLWALKQTSNTHIATGDSYRGNQAFDEALEEYQAARRFAFLDGPKVQKRIEDAGSLKQLATRYDSLVALGDTLASRASRDPEFFPQAMNAFEEAKALEYVYGVSVDSKIRVLRAEMDQQFDVYKERVRAFQNANGLAEARYAFEIAKLLKPDDPYVQNQPEELAAPDRRSE